MDKENIRTPLENQLDKLIDRREKHSGEGLLNISAECFALIALKYMGYTDRFVFTYRVCEELYELYQNNRGDSLDKIETLLIAEMKYREDCNFMHFD